MILCVLKRILHKKKSIFMQLLESPIPPLTAAHLIVDEYYEIAQATLIVDGYF